MIFKSLYELNESKDSLWKRFCRYFFVRWVDEGKKNIKTVEWKSVGSQNWSLEVFYSAKCFNLKFLYLRFFSSTLALTLDSYFFSSLCRNALKHWNKIKINNEKKEKKKPNQRNAKQVEGKNKIRKRKKRKTIRRFIVSMSVCNILCHFELDEGKRQ